MNMIKKLSNQSYNSSSSSSILRNGEISILAFEVANTIDKGSKLMQSLSEENVQILKNDILHSQGVQQLVATEMGELLSIAAADMREEFKVFYREVIRFGDMCKDPQWHNLGRLFSCRTEDIYFLSSVSRQAIDKRTREEPGKKMQELITLAQHTFELYHESIALDRVYEDYCLKLDKMQSFHLPLQGKSFTTLRSKIKHQVKLVNNLQKKSLWPKRLERVVEKLVDIVFFIQQMILGAFAENDLVAGSRIRKPEKLGATRLDLHYAGLITLISDIVASHPTRLHPNTRDALYSGLPTTVKRYLRYCLQAVNSKELTVPQIKAKMEETFMWLLPVATNTFKAHEGFGWVGDWANSEFGTTRTTFKNMIRLQTLYHADKQKMDQHILDLVTGLHCLLSNQPGDIGDNVPKYTTFESPTHKKGLILHSERQDLSPLSKIVNTEGSNSLQKINI